MSHAQEIEVVHPKVLALINKYNLWYHKPAAAEGKGKSGQPDFITLLNGVLLGIECKWDMYIDYSRDKLSRDKRKLPTVPQTSELRKIKQGGGMGLVVDNNTVGKLPELFKFVQQTGEVSYGYARTLGIDIEKYAQELQEFKL